MQASMKVDLEGKTAIVTGGGTGIGKAISVGLARNGAAVVVNYSKSKAEAEQTVSEIADAGGRAMAVPGQTVGPVQGFSAPIFTSTEP